LGHETSTVVSSPLVTGTTCTVVGATPATNWIFVEVECGPELVGTGEATLSGREEEVVAAVRALTPALVGRAPTDPWVNDFLAGQHGDNSGNLVWCAAASGLEQALWDLAEQVVPALSLSLPLRTAGDGSPPSTIPLYATVNRLLLQDRSPDAFAAAAVAASESGFRAVKCAPFDGVRPGEPLASQRRDLVETGLLRLRAIRRELGWDVPLLVDCHARFAAHEAAGIVDLLAETEPAWVESVIDDTDEAGWQALDGCGLVLAAGETLTTVEAVERMLTHTPVAVVMPDVKYVGGVGPLLRLLESAARCGRTCSPHNPSGPVGTLASAKAMVRAKSAALLEYAIEDVPWRADLVGGTEEVRDGCLVLPVGPGLAAGLDRALAARHPAHRSLHQLGAAV
jgi:galactonate dehydratase